MKEVTPCRSYELWAEWTCSSYFAALSPSVSFKRHGWTPLWTPFSSPIFFKRPQGTGKSRLYLRRSAKSTNLSSHFLRKQIPARSPAFIHDLRIWLIQLMNPSFWTRQKVHPQNSFPFFSRKVETGDRPFLELPIPQRNITETPGTNRRKITWNLFAPAY